MALHARRIILPLAIAVSVLMVGVRPARAVPTFSILGRVNLSSQEDQAEHVADEVTHHGTVSSNGRWHAFMSVSGNLVPNDTNGGTDAFVRDLVLGTTVRVDVHTDGTPPIGDHNGLVPSISNNGRWVVFESDSNLLIGTDTNANGSCDVGCDTNSNRDVFLRDRDTDGNGVFDEAGGVATTRISVKSTGEQAPLGGRSAWISGDGRWIAFASLGALVPEDTNSEYDVYVAERTTGALARVSVATDGTQGGDESDSGSRVFGFQPVTSDDGRFVVFGSYGALIAGDLNEDADVFLRDRDTDGDGVFDEPGSVATTLISRSATGQLLNNPGLSSAAGFGQVATISGNGRFVAWASRSSGIGLPDGNPNGADVYITDRQAGTLQRIGIDAAFTFCNDNFIGPQALSADGSRLTFTGQHIGYVGGSGGPSVCVNDVYVAERQGGIQRLTTTGDSVTSEEFGARAVALSDTGAVLFLSSTTTTFVANDTNTQADVFVAGEGPLTFPTPTATVLQVTPTPTATVLQGNPTPTLTCLGGTPTPRPTPATLDSFTSYGVKGAKGAPAFFALGPITLAAGNSYNVLKVANLLLPADTNDEGRHDQSTHLLEYGIKAGKNVPKFATLTDVRVLNQLDDLVVQLSKPVSLLVPTAKDLANPVAPPVEANHQRDHFLCFQVKLQKKRATGETLPKFPKGTQVDVEDQFQTRRYDLTKLSKLCVPTDKSGTPSFLKGPDKGQPATIAPASVRHADQHLLCYKAKLASTQIPQLACRPAKGPKIPKQAKLTPTTGIFVANQLGALRLDSTKLVEFCVPSFVDFPNN